MRRKGTAVERAPVLGWGRYAIVGTPTGVWTAVSFLALPDGFHWTGTTSDAVAAISFECDSGELTYTLIEQQFDWVNGASGDVTVIIGQTVRSGSHAGPVVGSSSVGLVAPSGPGSQGGDQIASDGVCYTTVDLLVTGADGPFEFELLVSRA